MTMRTMITLTPALLIVAMATTPAYGIFGHFSRAMTTARAAAATYFSRAFQRPVARAAMASMTGAGLLGLTTTKAESPTETPASCPAVESKEVADAETHRSGTYVDTKYKITLTPEMAERLRTASAPQGPTIAPFARCLKDALNGRELYPSCKNRLSQLRGEALTPADASTPTAAREYVYYRPYISSIDAQNTIDISFTAKSPSAFWKNPAVSDADYQEMVNKAWGIDKVTKQVVPHHYAVIAGLFGIEATAIQHKNTWVSNSTLDIQYDASEPETARVKIS